MSELSEQVQFPKAEKAFVPPTSLEEIPDTEAGKAPVNAEVWLESEGERYEKRVLATHSPAPKSVDADDTSTWRGGNTGK